MIVRGYVQQFRITTDLPEPSAKLCQLEQGDTVETLARREFAAEVRDGHDLRYYENVLLYVNRQAGRNGIYGKYQSPNFFGGGSDNIQLIAGKRIWLVSPGFAQQLERIVPSGSLTGGAVALPLELLKGKCINNGSFILRKMVDIREKANQAYG